MFLFRDSLKACFFIAIFGLVSCSLRVVPTEVASLEQQASEPPFVSQVSLSGNVLTVQGVNLEGVNRVRLQGGGIVRDLEIQTATSGQVRATAAAPLALAAGTLYNLLVSNASAETTVSFTMSLGEVPVNGLAVGGTQLVTSGGRVGVGTSEPAAPLEVNGEIKLGNSGLSCTAQVTGAIRYNSLSSQLEFCTGSAWNPLQATACDDAEPAAFSFANQSGVGLSTLILSDVVQVTGFNCVLTARISGGGTPSYRVCSDVACASVVQDWTSGTTTVVSNQYLQLRQTSSFLQNKTLNATLTLGGVAAVWSVASESASAVNQIDFTTETESTAFRVAVTNAPVVTVHWSDGTNETLTFSGGVASAAKSFGSAGHRAHYVTVDPASDLAGFGQLATGGASMSSVRGLGNFPNLRGVYFYYGVSAPFSQSFDFTNISPKICQLHMANVNYSVAECDAMYINYAATSSSAPDCTDLPASVTGWMGTGYDFYEGCTPSATSAGARAVLDAAGRR